MAERPLTWRSNEKASGQNPAPAVPSERGKAGWVAVGLLLSVFLAGGAFAAQTRFTDVTDDHPVDAIEWAADLGITQGCDTDKFCPDQPLKRRHARVFLERFYDQVLGASGDDEFSNPDFTRADMMDVLHRMIAPAPRATTTTVSPPADGNTVWLPRGDKGRVASGRCTHLISDNEDEHYDWEECAWSGSDDPVMGRAAMKALSARVWAETNAVGKPDAPPELTEGECPGWNVAACYIPGSHTISIESGVTLHVILHELAHALISGDDMMADCMADWRHAVPTCAHGALFRCAADNLYQRYADIDDAGVCGEVPDYGSWTRHRAETIDGHYTEWRVRNPDWGVGGTVMLGIRCAQGQRTVYFNGSIAYSRRSQGRAIIEYRFGEQDTTTAVTADMRGHPEGGYGDWWVIPPGEADRVLASLSDDSTRRLFVRLSNDSGVEAETTLKTTGYHDSMSEC